MDVFRAKYDRVIGGLLGRGGFGEVFQVVRRTGGPGGGSDGAASGGPGDAAAGASDSLAVTHSDRDASHAGKRFAAKQIPKSRPDHLVLGGAQTSAQRLRYKNTVYLEVDALR